MVLSSEDRGALHDLYARYAHTFDSGDIDAWLGLFAVNGRLTRAGVEPVVGTDDLRQFGIAGAETTPGIKHLMLNILVEATEGGAKGKAYFLCLRLGQDGLFRLRNYGRYDDEFVRVGETWKIANRTVIPELASELVDAPFSFGDSA